jgi:hypothetical protein
MTRILCVPSIPFPPCFVNIVYSVFVHFPQVAVDETNHRDCNHTFASLARDDPNPYVEWGYRL